MSEASLQSSVVQYLNWKHPRVIYCASLGGQYQRYHSQRLKAKATGYVKGFPDLGIYEPKGKYHGLFIEVKDKAYPTKEQKEWINKLNERGYLALCLRGYDNITKAIDSYLNETNK